MKWGRSGHWYADHANDDSFLQELCLLALPSALSTTVLITQPISYTSLPVTSSSSAAPTHFNAHSPALPFNMSILSPSSLTQPEKSGIGPMANKGALYPTIGISKLCHIAPNIYRSWLGDHSDVIKNFCHILQWCCRSSEHASSPRLIFRSIILPTTLPNGVPLQLPFYVWWT